MTFTIKFKKRFFFLLMAANPLAFFSPRNEKKGKNTNFEKKIISL